MAPRRLTAGYKLAEADAAAGLEDPYVGGAGPGKLIAPLALRSARKGADDFAKAIKAAVEADRATPS